MPHQFHLIGCHGSFGVGSVLAVRRRFETVPIASQIGRHHGKPTAKVIRNFVPHKVCLRISMQEKQWRTAASDYVVDMPTIHAKISLPEI